MPSTWLDLPADTGFGADNLPYGVFSDEGPPRVGVAVGDDVLDLAAAARAAGSELARVVAGENLDPLLAAGPAVWAGLRGELTEWLTEPGHEPAVRPNLVPRESVRLHLPFTVADFTDFYSSEQHATNGGRIIRPDSPPLGANWKHLPIGYHGRSATVFPSGTPIRRPWAQRAERGAAEPSFGPTERLDVEVEVGFVVGVPSRAGTPVPVGDFAEHVFGVCLVNDWSARDVQAWEMTPLGPFLAKSFATSVSPWVVPLAALAAARVPGPVQEPPVQPYLRRGEDWGLDLTCEFRLNGEVLSRPPFATQYWTAAQQLAHLTVNGAAVRTGDLYASGTVSGPEREQWGSLLELSWGGRDEITLAGGDTRRFLADGDEVTISATAPGIDGGRIDLGAVTGRIEPARPE